jgi:hypothetical protein
MFLVPWCILTDPSGVTILAHPLSRPAVSAAGHWLSIQYFSLSLPFLPHLHLSISVVGLAPRSFDFLHFHLLHITSLSHFELWRRRCSCARHKWPSSSRQRRNCKSRRQHNCRVSSSCRVSSVRLLALSLGSEDYSRMSASKRSATFQSTPGVIRPSPRQNRLNVETQAPSESPACKRVPRLNPIDSSSILKTACSTPWKTAISRLCSWASIRTRKRRSVLWKPTPSPSHTETARPASPFKSKPEMRSGRSLLLRVLLRRQWSNRLPETWFQLRRHCIHCRVRGPWSFFLAADIL